MTPGSDASNASLLRIAEAKRRACRAAGAVAAADDVVAADTALAAATVGPLVVAAVAVGTDSASSLTFERLGAARKLEDRRGLPEDCARSLA